MLPPRWPAGNVFVKHGGKSCKLLIFLLYYLYAEQKADNYV